MTIICMPPQQLRRVTFTRTDVRPYFEPGNREQRILFAERCVTALKRTAFYATHKLLFEALKANEAQLGPDTVMTAATWQKVYDRDLKTLARPALLERLLRMIPVLLGDAAAVGIHLFAHAPTFENTLGQGDYFPEGFKLPFEASFHKWLDDGKDYEERRTKAGGPSVEGLYDIYFPWLENGEWGRRIAQATARIYRDGERVAFESYGNVLEDSPVLYTGQLRFTGHHSAVLVGFTSIILSRGPTKLSKVACSEMLMHPYRLPAERANWWHGTTTFMSSDTNDYSATVAHVMRLRPGADANAAANLEAWRKELVAPTRLLKPGTPHYAEVLAELRSCPLAELRDQVR